MPDLYPDSALDRRKGWASTSASTICLRFPRTGASGLIRWEVWVPTIGGGIVSFCSPFKDGAELTARRPFVAHGRRQT